MKLMNILLAIVVSVNLFGCATNSKTRWALMGVAAPTGAVVGASTSPDEIKSEYNAFYISAVFTAVAALIGEVFFSDRKEIDRLKAENYDLKNKPVWTVIDEGTGYFKSPFDKSGKKKVKWKRSEGSKWIDDGPNVKYHQNMKIEKIIDEKQEK